MVEIDILAECKHKNVVGLYEAYYFDNKLWVCSHFDSNIYGDIKPYSHFSTNAAKIRTTGKASFYFW